MRKNDAMALFVEQSQADARARAKRANEVRRESVAAPEPPPAAATEPRLKRRRHRVKPAV